MKNRAYVSMIALLFVWLAFMTGCDPFCVLKGSGEVIEESIDVPSFTSVGFSGVGNLYFEQGDDWSLRVVTDENLLDYLRIERRNNRLIIGLERGCVVRDYTRLDYYLTGPDMEAISLSGSGKFFSEKGIKGKNLDLRVSGSGHITATVSVEFLNSGVSGSGNITLEGTVSSHDMSISGSGNIWAPGCETEYADASISGSGKARLFVTNRLRSRISGSGSIEYKGNPEVNSSVSGSGRVVNVK
jgi:hypothetical protein